MQRSKKTPRLLDTDARRTTSVGEPVYELTDSCVCSKSGAGTAWPTFPMDYDDRQVRRSEPIHLHLATISRRTITSMIDGVTARERPAYWYSVVHERTSKSRSVGLSDCSHLVNLTRHHLPINDLLFSRFDSITHATGDGSKNLLPG